MLPDYENKRTTTIMEKILPYIELIILLIIIQSVVTLFTTKPAEEDAIRFRLLAHSNAPADQQVKMDIQSEIEPLIEEAIATAESTEELGDNLAALETTIVDIANSLAGGMPISLERQEALFPPKRSGFVITPQATYDAYVLTIGSGRGDNWWCSLFPNICFPDEAEEEEEKVTFFLWEWIKGIFS
ncbi:stage II sporulation protein R [Sporosarcina sp. FSL K6-1522]|uniref:stage II sporulation protein R n=1 Tax=Sporosarcina sp. FSL K6-1522 TaxID=2921554 RepID=UPI003159992D